MAEKAAIQLAIEKLASWLAKEDQRCIIKKADFRDDCNEKLSSLVVEKADFCNLVVGMAELWEDNKEKLYSFLVGLVNPKRRPESALKDSVCNLMLDMADFLEDHDKGNINKKRLHSLLVKMAEHMFVYHENFYSLIVEMTGVWKDNKGKLSKEKLNSWLANKGDLWDYDKLLLFLQDFTDPQVDEEVMTFHTQIWYNVRDVRDELKQILDIIRDVELRLEETVCKRLHYLISDALEMAHHAQLFVQVKDSDPFILYLQIYRCFFKKMQEGFLDQTHPLCLFSKKIVLIRRYLQETKERILKFGVKRKMNVREEMVDPTYSDVVGLDEDMELLLHSKKTIICIAGMGGIGKTTLARQFYNHAPMVDHYEGRAWVNLFSQELSRKEILIELLRQLQIFERDAILLEKMDNTRLREMLSQHLEQGMRVFIVLDHVSDNTYLEYISQVLPQDKGIRLLFTTRSNKAYYSFLRDYDYHMMKILDDEKSWQLLLKTAFSGISDEEFPKQLKEKQRVILRKCGGLPLAIKEVGRHWAEMRRSGSGWEQIVDESSIHLDLTSTLAALEPIYHNLPPEFKQCFLYLGLFKEGATINAKKMRHVCTAGIKVSTDLEEQFINNSLYEFSTHSIIEVTTYKICMGVNMRKTFRINAVFQRLSIKIAEDEMGLDILRNDGNNRPSHEPRHRVIHCSREKFNFINNSSTNQTQDEHLVSLFFHGGGYFDDSPSYWNNFKQLKILDMEGFGLKILPKTVGELSKLRYLGLRNNYIQELPRSLGRLKNLEVLDIAENFMVEVDADIICEMDSLRHLYMSNITCRKPLKIDALKNLKTLTYISIDNWAYEVSRLKMMTSLHKLGIEELDENSDVGNLFASLSELKELKCLILRGFRFRRMPSLDDISLLQNLNILDGRLTRLPSADSFPPNIYDLSLINSCLDEDPMPILEKLPLLGYLKLLNAYTGQQMVISSNGFSHLSYLVIGELWHLRDLQIKEGALPYLSILEIYCCPYQENPLTDIGMLYYLRKLKIVTTKNIATKIRADPRLKNDENYGEVDIQP